MNPTSLPLIPRRHIFGNPARSVCQISPDGVRLAWVAPLNGVSNLWISDRGDIAGARPVTSDRGRGIHGFSWRSDSAGLLYVQDQNGDENWHVWTVPADGGAARDLTPYPGVRAGIARVSPYRHQTILLTINDRDLAYGDLYEVDIASGERVRILENPGFADIVTDDAYVPRLAEQFRRDGGKDILRCNDAGDWALWQSFSPEDARTSGILELSADGGTAFLLDSRDRDMAALVSIDLRTDAVAVIASDPRADITGYIGDKQSYVPLAYSVNYERRETIALGAALADDIALLDGMGRGGWSIASRSADDRWWTVGVRSDRHAGMVFLYDRRHRALTPLYDARPELASAPLRPMRSEILRAEDGLPLICYLTLPDDVAESGTENGAPPLVLHVHGGPWTRDSFGYDPIHQWLADRGYAVLSVNFRSSTGLGKRFLAAGDGEWGGRMDGDLETAVDWAIASGYADTERLAIMGTSYGGYAVLSALTQRPGRYACGIDVVGPSNLETLLAATPPYWEAQRAMLYRALGNPETPEGRKSLRDKSPVHRAGVISRPLLIGQGANDPRVPQAESDQMVAAIRAAGGEVTYVVYSDEGHGFVREPNQLSFLSVVEEFLVRHLGGRLEPVTPDELAGTTRCIG